jgi:hypothetical protein
MHRATVHARRQRGRRKARRARASGTFARTPPFVAASWRRTGVTRGRDGSWAE